MTGHLPRISAAQYGLAYLGAHLAFMPLLVLLLPRRVESFAGLGADVGAGLGAGIAADAGEMLSWLLLVGACVAGTSHIISGHLSDRWLERHGNRRGLILIGTAALALSYLLLALAMNFWQLMAAIVLFQLALNIAFSPLGALLADYFPHAQKGRMGGLMSAALPASTLAVVLVGWIFPQDRPAAFLFAGALAVSCFVPLLAGWRLGDVSRQGISAAGERITPAANGQLASPLLHRRDYGIAWSARLAVQLGSAFVHGYIYLYLASFFSGGEGSGSGSATSILAALSAPAAVLAIAVTLASGAYSDRAGKRRMPLLVAACAVAFGLAALSQAQAPVMLLAAYVVFYAGLSAFLSIDTALVAQLVSGHRNRGSLLGIMNLTNTLPSVIAPGLALLAYQDSDLQDQLSALFLISAIISLLGGIGILSIRSVP